MTRQWAYLAVALCVGCFEPDLPVGQPCSELGSCPPGQLCVYGVCQLEQSSLSGTDGGFVRDAGMIDAVPVSCTPVSSTDSTCDGVDDDCDGSFDEDSAGMTRIYYRDADGDGYGVTSASIKACVQPSGYASQAGDCWDSNDPSASKAYPGQTMFYETSMPGGPLPFDWNCDGGEEYELTDCTGLRGLNQCHGPAESGWTGPLPYCGQTADWCIGWDLYKDYCYDSEPKTQRCR